MTHSKSYLLTTKSLVSYCVTSRIIISHNGWKDVGTFSGRRTQISRRRGQKPSWPKTGTCLFLLPLINLKTFQKSVKYIETTSTNTVWHLCSLCFCFLKSFFFRYHRNLFLKANSLMTIVEKLDANGLITQSL